MRGMGARLFLRRITLVLAALLLGGTGWFLWNGLADAHPAAVRNRYVYGEITLEQARQEVGDVADTWVELRQRIERQEQDSE